MAFIPFKSSTVHKISLVNFYLNVFQWNTKNFQHAECNELVAGKSKKKAPARNLREYGGRRIEPRTYQEGSNDRVVRGFTFPSILAYNIDEFHFVRPVFITYFSASELRRVPRGTRCGNAVRTGSRRGGDDSSP